VRLEMRRPEKQLTILRWPPWGWTAVLLILPAFDPGWTGGESTAPCSPHSPLASKPFESPSRQLDLALENSGESSILLNSVWELLELPAIHPGDGSKLDLCAEFLKPDSLKIRMMGTPKNHRSPPA